MGRTFVRQDAQIGSTTDTLAGYNDGIAPSLANFQTNSANLAQDLNNVRSMLSHLKDVQVGNWYDVLVTPSTLEAGSQRGVDDLNEALHVVEKKRVLRDVLSLADVAVGAGNNFAILGTGELPSPTTAAVGAVTTLGTVVAFHTGTFGTHSLDEVAGPNALSPKNLLAIVDGSTRDPILSGGRMVWGLLQSETATDGHTITDTTPYRVQISFVRVNATGDDLEACPVADIEGKTINYASRERVRLEDLTEADFLKGAIVDIPSGTTVDRQTAYDNQGTTPVDLTTNATLDLEGAGLVWAIRDDLEAVLFRIIEGSAGGTSEVEIGADVDLFDVNAVAVDVSSGISVATGKTRPIDIGETDGVIETTAGLLKLLGATQLAFEDSNKSGSTFGTDLVLSDTSAEWSEFETHFGESSLLNAINLAYSTQIRTKVQAVLTANVTAGNDVNGPGTPHSNTDVDLPPYDQVGSFSNDVDVYLNGELLRSTDDYTQGGTPSEGDLQFTFNLKGTGTKPDQLTVIVVGQ